MTSCFLIDSGKGVWTDDDRYKRMEWITDHRGRKLPYQTKIILTGKCDDTMTHVVGGALRVHDFLCQKVTSHSTLFRDWYAFHMLKNVAVLFYVFFLSIAEAPYSWRMLLKYR